MDPERLSFYATIFIHQAFLEDGPINGQTTDTNETRKNGYWVVSDKIAKHLK